MRKAAILILSASVVLASCGNQNNRNANSGDTVSMRDNPPAGITEDDREFIEDAAVSGLLEIELGKLAQAQGHHQRVKDFGAMMVNDHQKSAEELKLIAQQKDINVPGSLTQDDLEPLEELKKKSGVDFDKDYIKMMLSHHRDAIEDFEKASRFTDPEISAYAGKTLPTLNAHLDSAKSINKVVKASLEPGDFTDGMETHSNR